MTAAHSLPGVDLTYRDDDSCIAAYGPVFLAISSSRSSYAGLEASRALHERLQRTYPDGFAKMVVSAGGARMPTTAEREKLQRIATEFASSTLALALVFEGDGIWQSSMRMVANAMMLTVRRKYPQRMFASVPEAAVWLAAQCGRAARFDVDDLVTAVAALRAT